MNCQRCDEETPLSIEPALRDAIARVVAEKNQPEQVTRRLIAWLEEINRTELGRDDQMQHLANLRDAIALPEDLNED